MDMEEVREEILRVFQVDIKKDKLIKLYGIEKGDSEEKLKEIFQKKRKTWEKSLNGTNEKYIQNAQKNLEKADAFEAILLDKRLRTQLFEFYAQEEKTVTKFAEVYFDLVKSSASLDKKQVEFFFAYFPEEKQNRRMITEMLKKKYNFRISDEKLEKKNEDEGKKEKKKTSLLIANNFSRETVLALRKCELIQKEAAEQSEILERFPKLKTSLWEFLGLETFKKYQDFADYIEEQRKQCYEWKQEKGTLYTPVTFYNVMQDDIIGKSDVSNNFEEFKLIVQYTKLNPYMFVLEKIKPAVMDSIVEIARTEYNFQNKNEFLIEYFGIVYDNFGIYDNTVKKMIRKARKEVRGEKSKEKYKLIFGVDHWKEMAQAYGISGNKEWSIGLRILYGAVAWPLHFVLTIIEVFKVIVDKLHWFSILLFAPITMLWIRLSGIWEELNFEQLRNSDVVTWWNALMEGGRAVPGTASYVFWTISMVIFYFAIVFVVPYAASRFLWVSGIKLRKEFDFVGLERTMMEICKRHRQKFVEKYHKESETIVSQMFRMALINLIGLLIVIFVIRYGIIGIIRACVN